MSRSQDYHNATKYRPETIASHPGLDWDRKPPTTKSFHGENRIDLRPHLALTRCDDTQSPRLIASDEDSPLDLKRLSTFLLHVYGVTAVANDGANEHTFRAAPSAGALYPNEIYLALRDIDGLADGLYNYQATDHQLAPVCEGNFQGDLRHLFFEATATHARCIALVTAVFYRSAWRYHERGYRRVLLDTGHLLGNAHSIAPFLSLQICALPSFQDAGLASLLLLDDEKEAVIAAFSLDDIKAGPFKAPVLGRVQNDSRGSQEASAQSLHRSGYLESFVPATIEAEPFLKPEGFEDLPQLPLRPEPLNWEELICRAILMRRSARAFSGATMSKTDLATILHQSYGKWEGADAAYCDLQGLRTLLVIHRVEDLTPGLYEFDAETNSICLWRAGNFSSECCQIALGQDIALQSSAMVAQVANLDQQDQRFGDRGYRHLGLDAGIIGQRMSLAAEALSLGTCGIGGYFDDQVNELFGLSSRESVIYLTCLGPKSLA